MSLGKAVPPSQEVPSLIYQLAQASNQKNVEFASITSGGGPAAQRHGERTPRRPPPASPQMPFTFVFNGSFFDLYNLFQQLNNFTVRTTSGEPEGQRPPADDPERQAGPVAGRSRLGQGLANSYGHDHRDRVRAARRQGLTGGATATSPAAARRRPRAPAASSSRHPRRDRATVNP